MASWTVPSTGKRLGKCSQTVTRGHLCALAPAGRCVLGGWEAPSLGDRAPLAGLVQV